MIILKLLCLLLLLAWDVCVTIADQDVENLTLDGGTTQMQYQHDNGTKETVTCPRYFITLPFTSAQKEIRYKLEQQRWSDRVILDLLYYGLQHGGNGGGSVNASSTQKQQIKWDVLQRSENSHCTWEGVLCDRKNKVIQIVLSKMGLSGTLPDELHQMSQLRVFDVRNNKIHATLPASYGALSHLEMFNVRNNDLSGSIPKSYRGMTDMDRFILSENSLSGTISNRMLHDWKHLIVLDLAYNRFKSSIPNALFEDKLQLVNISLAHNYLTGTIPPVPTKLEKLNLLDLSMNQLKGPIPRLENSMPNLNELDLKINLLTGSIPTEIFLLSNMRKIVLGSNRLTGTLPRGDDAIHRLEAIPTGGKWGDMKSLKHLDLRSNRITGTIPDQLPVGLASRLTNLNLGFNYLEGTLPTYLGKMTRLQVLSVPYNNLEGGIPVQLANTSKLIKFNFTQNRFTHLPLELCDRLELTKETINYYLIGCNMVMCEKGSFTLNGASDMYSGCQFCKGLTGPEKDYIGRATCPTQKFLYGDQNMDNVISEPEVLRLFHVSNGGLHWGKKYEEWGNSDGDPCLWHGITCANDHVTKIDLSEVLLCGDLGRNPLGNDECRGIPSELALLTHLEVLNLGKQKYLRGTLPWEIGLLSNLKHLEISNALAMKGSIPTSFGQLSKLKVLNLSGCKYRGTIPEEIYQLKRLQKLHLNMNLFTGSISSSISNMTSLNEFLMSRNYLTSFIPEEMGKVTTIENMELYGNYLAGTIPASIGNCTNLKRMDLFNNQLTGTLPDSLSKLQSLQILHLKMNQLTGTIPSHFGELSFLSWFDVSSNRLHGTIPKTFGTCRNLQDFRVGNNRIYAPIPPSLCRNLNINGGITATYGCDGVVCPLGTYSDSGHAKEGNDEGCLPCPEGQTTMYLGSKKCEVITDHDILTMFYDVLLHDLDQRDQNQLSSEMGGGLYKEGMIHQYDTDNDEEANVGGHGRHTQSHWNWKDPSTSVCEWKGVRCDSKGEILSFRFPTPHLHE